MKIDEILTKIIKEELGVDFKDNEEVLKFLKKGEIEGIPFENFIYKEKFKKTSILMALYNLDENRLHYNGNDYYFGNNKNEYIYYKYYDEESEKKNSNFEKFLNSIKIEKLNIFEVLDKNYEFFIYGG